MKHLLYLSFSLLLITQTVFAQCPQGFDLIPKNLVKNGDFESGNTAFSSHYRYALDLYPEGYYAVVHQPYQTHPHFTFNRDHSSGAGKMMVVNGATESGKVVWQQEVAMDPSKRVYTFSAWFMTVSPASNPALLDLMVNGKPLAEVQLSSSTYKWLHFSGIWIAPENTETITLTIVNRNTIAGGNDFAIDDIELHPCEPIFASLPKDESWDSITELAIVLD